MSDPLDELLTAIIALQERIRDAVVAACEAQSLAASAAVASDAAGDTIYAIDRIGEATLVEGLAGIAEREPLILIAEGLAAGGICLPRGTPGEACRWRVICDPIDGTRGLMYQKRPAWILTGVAPDRGPDTRLADIELAVQTEIPLLKQHLSDVFWARRGSGVHGEQYDRIRGRRRPLQPRPSSATTIAHGFATLARFFPPGRELLAAIDDRLVEELLGPPATGKAPCFEDQYISTGGQIAELIGGHDRFIADIRPLVQQATGSARGLCCHPYDLATALIAEEAGVVLRHADGRCLDAPLDLATDVDWCGYANDNLHTAIEPVLQRLLRERGLLTTPDPSQTEWISSGGTRRPRRNEGHEEDG